MMSVYSTGNFSKFNISSTKKMNKIEHLHSELLHPKAMQLAKKKKYFTMTNYYHPLGTGQIHCTIFIDLVANCICIYRLFRVFVFFRLWFNNMIYVRMLFWFLFWTLFGLPHFFFPSLFLFAFQVSFFLFFFNKFFFKAWSLVSSRAFLHSLYGKLWLISSADVLTRSLAILSLICNPI